MPALCTLLPPLLPTAAESRPVLDIGLDMMLTAIKTETFLLTVTATTADLHCSYKQQEMDLPSEKESVEAASKERPGPVPEKNRPMSHISGVRKLKHANSFTGIVPKYGVETPHQEELGTSLSDMDRWGIDLFQLAQFSNSRPLTSLCYTILQERELVKTFKIPASTLVTYLMHLEDHYHRDTPYHNSIHAADVVQSTHVLMSATALEDCSQVCLQLFHRRGRLVVENSGNVCAKLRLVDGAQIPDGLEHRSGALYKAATSPKELRVGNQTQDEKEENAETHPTHGLEMKTSLIQFVYHGILWKCLPIKLLSSKEPSQHADCAAMAALSAQGFSGQWLPATTQPNVTLSRGGGRDWRQPAGDSTLGITRALSPLASWAVPVTCLIISSREACTAVSPRALPPSPPRSKTRIEKLHSSLPPWEQEDLPVVRSRSLCFPSAALQPASLGTGRPASCEIKVIVLPLSCTLACLLGTGRPASCEIKVIVLPLSCTLACLLGTGRPASCEIKVIVLPLSCTLACLLGTGRPASCEIKVIVLPLSCTLACLLGTGRPASCEIKVIVLPLSCTLACLLGTGRPASCEIKVIVLPLSCTLACLLGTGRPASCEIKVIVLPLSCTLACLLGTGRPASCEIKVIVLPLSCTLACLLGTGRPASCEIKVIVLPLSCTLACLPGNRKTCQLCPWLCPTVMNNLTENRQKSSMISFSPVPTHCGPANMDEGAVTDPNQPALLQCRQYPDRRQTLGHPSIELHFSRDISTAFPS
ncbi:hypothetical protein ACOMHN_009589 [Nucella lapillus]